MFFFLGPLWVKCDHCICLNQTCVLKIVLICPGPKATKGFSMVFLDQSSVYHKMGDTFVSVQKLYRMRTKNLFESVNLLLPNRSEYFSELINLFFFAAMYWTRCAKSIQVLLSAFSMFLFYFFNVINLFDYQKCVESILKLVLIYTDPATKAF